MSSPSHAQIQISPHIDGKHVILTIDGQDIGLDKSQALHAAVLLLETSVELNNGGYFTGQELSLLDQLNRRLKALGSSLS